MCNFAAELKHVANKEKLVDIQWDNTFKRAFLKSNKKARYKSKQQSDNYQAFTLSLTFENFRKIAMYRLYSLNADIQLIVDGAWESDFLQRKAYHLQIWLVNRMISSI